MADALVLEHRGCRLNYRLYGAGVPVLFIQGVGVHGDGWRPQVEQLSEQYHCLTFDNRGMGRSQPVGAPLTIEQMAEDAQALMDRQGWPTAHLVGHSMGGVIALQLALASPARVRSLSLLCTFARGSDATKLSLWMLWVGLRSRIGPRRARRNAFLQIVMPPDELARADRHALAAQLAEIFGHDLADQPAIAMQQLAALRRYDATPRLKELALPALVISGRHDRLSPPEIGHAIADGIAGARFVEIDEAAHGAPIQSAREINSLLLEHFAGADRMSAV